jgi:hypothetical protein
MFEFTHGNSRNGKVKEKPCPIEIVNRVLKIIDLTLDAWHE